MEDDLNILLMEDNLTFKMKDWFVKTSKTSCKKRQIIFLLENKNV